MASANNEASTAPVTEHVSGTSGRFAAGEDPAKREQILEGARRVFMRVGFDAASMNDVTREAGVSKGTIYVYFANKEDLFEAMIDREKQRFIDALRGLLAEATDARSGLTSFAEAFIQQVTGSQMIPAMRSVLGVIKRMPGLCRRFLSAPNNVRTVLEDFLDRQVAAGALMIDDTDIAARQFIELSTGTYFKLRLFDEITAPPPREEVERVVSSGVMVFLAAYGPDGAVARARKAPAGV